MTALASVDSKIAASTQYGRVANENFHGLGHQVKEYFVVSPTGFYLHIGSSKGFDRGFTFVIQMTSKLYNKRNIKQFSSYLRFRMHQEGTYIVDNDGNRLSIEELLDFAAYSRNRADVTDWRFNDDGEAVNEQIIDSDGFAFTDLRSRHISYMIKNRI